MKNKTNLKCLKTIMKNDKPLTRFYTSLIIQKPKSEMAIKWCFKNGYTEFVNKYGDPSEVKRIIDKSKIKIQKLKQKLKQKQNNKKKKDEKCIKPKTDKKVKKIEKCFSKMKIK
jgi:hypothetical protein